MKIGILYIVASTTAMSFADSLVKLVSGDLSIWQIFALRSAFAVLTLLAIRRLTKTATLWENGRWIMVRSVLLATSWVAYYACLPFMSLSAAAVLLYTSPIFTLVFAAFFLGERTELRHILGAVIGFAGVNFILRPDTQSISWVSFLPILAALLYSLAMILTRGKCKNEHPLVLSLSLHGTFLASGLIAIPLLSLIGLKSETISRAPFLLHGWLEIDNSDIALMAFLGVLSAIYFLGVAKAYQVAPPQIIGTFDYAYLVSAVLWGSLLFQHDPNFGTIAGVGLIIASGLLAGSGPGRKRAR